MEPWHVAMVTAGWEDPSAGWASRRGPGQGRVSGGVPGSGAPSHHHLHGNNQRSVYEKDHNQNKLTSTVYGNIFIIN